MSGAFGRFEPDVAELEEAGTTDVVCIPLTEMSGNAALL